MVGEVASINKNRAADRSVHRAGWTASKQHAGNSYSQRRQKPCPRYVGSLRKRDMGDPPLVYFGAVGNPR